MRLETTQFGDAGEVQIPLAEYDAATATVWLDIGSKADENVVGFTRAFLEPQLGLYGTFQPLGLSRNIALLEARRRWVLWQFLRDEVSLDETADHLATTTTTLDRLETPVAALESIVQFFIRELVTEQGYLSARRDLPDTISKSMIPQKIETSGLRDQDDPLVADLKILVKQYGRPTAEAVGMAALDIPAVIDPLSSEKHPVWNPVDIDIPDRVSKLRTAVDEIGIGRNGPTAKRKATLSNHLDDTNSDISHETKSVLLPDHAVPLIDQPAKVPGIPPVEETGPSLGISGLLYRLYRDGNVAAAVFRGPGDWTRQINPCIEDHIDSYSEFQQRWERAFFATGIVRALLKQTRGSDRPSSLSCPLCSVSLGDCAESQCHWSETIGHLNRHLHELIAELRTRLR